MAIITTGISHTYNERVLQICNYIRKVQEDFRDRVKQSGVQYKNMFDYLNSKAAEGHLG